MHGFRPTRRWLTRATLGAAATLQAPGWLGAALAQGAGQAGGRLRVGMAAPNTTLDPHFQSNAPNNAVASHIFDALITNDARSLPRPGLAQAWKLLDETHWKFQLRETTFSDGTDFTAEDAIVSLQRANDIPSTASFRTYTRSIKAMTALSPHSLLIETHGPDPLLLNSLGRLRVISADHKDAPTTEFNNGNATIGTGPLVLQEYVPGSHLHLTRNDAWWGGRLPWSEVVLRLIPDEGARLAALLAGELDIIEAVPFQGAQRVKENPGFHLIRGISSRFVYFAMDQRRDSSPFITDHAGRPLDRNPLKDRRVRQALSMALSREALAARVMEGDAVVASQFLPKGSAGTSDKLEVVPHDPDAARALLAEAGYPDGFGLTIHGPNDRYVNDARIVQAAAQMLTRIGIAARAEVMPWSVYSRRNSGAEFSMSLSAWGVNTGETSNPLKALLATYDKKAGMGASNSGRYSNPDLDGLLQQALRSMDEAARNALLAQACELAFNDHALLPLHHEVSTWAARKGVTCEARADQYTLASGISRA
ncbi:ABC transporter substrate-binding protein [Pseudoroseomonas ludipueritiae]|uniref:ABC transporter substrate-binding protein n=1 Tax=Pseudoroseomonas ludipueritiae TaxID=198093 RepID=A0ABR7RDI3_9PROT|nr:ABC transporter substrate-binding protein [Pseudoroseomonas ludipueritiae]MBC9179905.1 ABC transporter substrate-binding protein [Pseudoroseomonas ludipueritiae]